MYICFAEYRISTEHRESYLSCTEGLLTDSLNVYLYEGINQPNLFVEVWQAKTAEEADRIKKERCSERSPWSRVNEWIIGGAEKMHIWTFKPAHTPEKVD
ncbi:hypothetical protein L1N85_05390 [Paenibacillus alkaliterrae]|uniref:hypothetical protein n=1 Tax=Paenibacillus alkaliterrae TaxID=320909 RepID=UPI001F18EE5D|nr:hypothetical protein [Paenibacillus alkaliterrae]MCF2937859.1 hypothetical protein [Paenibacillus alkaliterrae]